MFSAALTAIGLASLTSAWAGAACEDLDHERFRTLIIDSQNAIDRGDLPLLKTILGEVERDLGCLVFAPPPRQWAELMVVYAVANHADGENWKAPLAAALRIRPGIDRGVGASHPIYDWEPPEPGQPRPYDGEDTLYVDGRESQMLPPEGGWYLIQKTDGDYWSTFWQRGAPVDREWAEEPVERPDEVFWQIGAGAQGGMLHITQWSEQLGDDGWVPYGSRFYDIPLPIEAGAQKYSQPGWGFTTEAKVTFRNLGIHAAGGAMWNLGPGMRNARISGIYDTRRFTAGVGLSLFDVFLARRPGPTEDRDEPLIEVTSFMQRFYHLEGAVRSSGPLEVQASVVAGLHSLATYAGIFDVTLTFRGISVFGGHPQVGGRLMGAMGRYVWRDGDGLRVTTAGLRATTHVTLRFGKDYR